MRNRNRLIPSIVLVLVTVVLVSVIVLIVPNRAIDIFPAIFASTAVLVLILWRSDFDSKLDERTMQFFGYGARNAFILLLFAMPWLAAYHVLGIFVLDAGITLLILWILSIGIAWVTFLYHYSR